MGKNRHENSFWLQIPSKLNPEDLKKKNMWRSQSTFLCIRGSRNHLNHRTRHNVVLKQTSWHWQIDLPCIDMVYTRFLRRWSRIEYDLNSHHQPPMVGYRSFLKSIEPHTMKKQIKSTVRTSVRTADRRLVGLFFDAIIHVTDVNSINGTDATCGGVFTFQTRNQIVRARKVQNTQRSSQGAFVWKWRCHISRGEGKANLSSNLLGTEHNTFSPSLISTVPAGHTQAFSTHLAPGQAASHWTSNEQGSPLGWDSGKSDRHGQIDDNSILSLISSLFQQYLPICTWSSSQTQNPFEQDISLTQSDVFWHCIPRPEPTKQRVNQNLPWIIGENCWTSPDCFVMSKSQACRSWMKTFCWCWTEGHSSIS